MGVAWRMANASGFWWELPGECCLANAVAQADGSCLTAAVWSPTKDRNGKGKDWKGKGKDLNEKGNEWNEKDSKEIMQPLTTSQRKSDKNQIKISTAGPFGFFPVFTSFSLTFLVIIDYHFSISLLYEGPAVCRLNLLQS